MFERNGEGVVRDALEILPHSGIVLGAQRHLLQLAKLQGGEMERDGVPAIGQPHHCASVSGTYAVLVRRSSISRACISLRRRAVSWRIMSRTDMPLASPWPPRSSWAW